MKLIWWLCYVDSWLLFIWLMCLFLILILLLLGVFSFLIRFSSVVLFELEGFIRVMKLLCWMFRWMLCSICIFLGLCW